MTIDGTGRFVYVVNSGSNSISGYRIDDASDALASLPGLPCATGSVPQSITSTHRASWPGPPCTCF